MAQLAIKGHPTRGKEVIEILEMLGGRIRRDRLAGNELFSWYYINGNGYIDYKHYSLFDDTMVLILEEFIEKFPYKIGDKVIAYVDGCLAQFTIQGIRWNHELNRVEYRICSSWRDTSLIQPYKEKTTDKANKAVFDANAQCCDIMNLLIMEETIKIDIPKGYEFAGVDDNNQQVVFEKIGCQYPKTYEKCCEITNSKIDRHYFYTKKDKEDYPEDVKIMDSLDNLRRLLICRNAYWKIAGDWKPDWKNGLNKYCIVIYGNRIIRECYVSANATLAFPTEEMRDAFYENFKGLIEQCKELL